MIKSKMPDRGQNWAKPGYSRKQFQFGTSFVEIYLHKGKGTWAGELYWLRPDTKEPSWVQVFSLRQRDIPRLLRVARAEKLNPKLKEVTERMRGKENEYTEAYRLLKNRNESSKRYGK